MRKEALAEELRQRQRELGRVDREKIEAATDDQIITAHITCAHCGARLLPAKELAATIAQAENADDCWRRVQEVSRRHDDTDEGRHTRPSVSPTLKAAPGPF